MSGREKTPSTVIILLLLSQRVTLGSAKLLVVREILWPEKIVVFPVS